MIGTLIGAATLAVVLFSGELAPTSKTSTTAASFEFQDDASTTENPR